VKTIKSMTTAGIMTCACMCFCPAQIFAAQTPSDATIVASGLLGPRGLSFGPDHDLYIAEAGSGGPNATSTQQCMQVPVPIGPYTGGLTGRISKVDGSGKLSTVASGFPSTISEGGTIGVADVVFLDGTLYALIGGGGCSHGNPDPRYSNGIAKVNLKSGKWKLIANLGIAYLGTHPAKFDSADDFEPDGTYYNMIAAHGRLVTVEPNHGNMLAVSPSGQIETLLDISASQGHIVPTSLAEQDGAFYVGNLNLFPIDPQWARVQIIRRHEFEGEDLAPGFEGHGKYHIVDSKAGFTTVVSVRFGPDGLLYVLELSDAAGLPTPGEGKVVRVKHSGEIEDVITGLTVPTAMTFGPNGYLYVSNLGAAPAGAGQILKFAITPGW
jgi:hypothetical protein